jgi:serine/threonine protein phosphatase PrpC
MPGLAMSRSFGDSVAHSVGVSCEAEIIETVLTKDEIMIISGSDGIWEFLSNQEVAEIVYPFYNLGAPEAAANELVKRASQKWKSEESVVDDITCVILFLNNDPIV